MVVFDEAQAIKNADTRRARAAIAEGAVPARAHRHAHRELPRGALEPVRHHHSRPARLAAAVSAGVSSRRSTQPQFRALQALSRLIRPSSCGGPRAPCSPNCLRAPKSTLESTCREDERAFYEAHAPGPGGPGGTARQRRQGGQSRIHLLAELIRLRRACCNPALMIPTPICPAPSSTRFWELVADLIRKRHKALVFSQFVGHLARVAEVLREQGIALPISRRRHARAGARAARRGFQAGEGDLFLISLKAGGTGLNLTAADYVIHLDPWWNPAVEDQASDRAHRIGQTRPVTIYRLIVRDTIEEKILELHRSKRDLASDLLEGAEMSARLTDEDLLNLIRVAGINFSNRGSEHGRVYCVDFRGELTRDFQ